MTRLYISLVFLPALVTGCHSQPPPKPLDQLTPPERSGHAVFAAKCGQCHNDRIDRPLHGPPLTALYKRPYLPSGAPANDERVVNVVRHGRLLMPPMGDTLSKEETDDLLAYLHTL